VQLGQLGRGGRAQPARQRLLAAHDQRLRLLLHEVAHRLQREEGAAYEHDVELGLAGRTLLGQLLQMQEQDFMR